ncbi:MAG TPA: hypothetical protein VMZ00_04135 [Sporichthya sp.]|nr:hypothetical protein [Sporichthya sp.]
MTASRTVTRNVGKAVLATGLVVGLTPVLGANPAYACSCVAPRSDDELRQASDVVFKGKVLSKSGGVDSPGNTGAETVTYSFSVKRTLKGKVRVPQQVSTAGSSATCGIRLSVGSTYLVYATKAEPEGKGKAARRAADRKPLEIGLCGGTHKVR